MKTLIFDSGPIISLVTNNMMHVLSNLKSKFNGDFYITPRVYYELVTRPLEIKRFEFEALIVLKNIKHETIKVIKPEGLKELTEELLYLSHHIYSVNKEYIKIVHYPEIESVASAVLLKSQAIVIDERSMRMIIEDPKGLQDVLKNRLHQKVEFDSENYKKLKLLIGNLKVIRSTELIAVAYEFGLLNEYLPSLPDSKKILLDAALWGLKLNGCAISAQEIKSYLKLEN